MTTQTITGRYQVYSLESYRNYPSVVPAAEYDDLDAAIKHTETVTYPMGVIDKQQESRGFVYVSNQHTNKLRIVTVYMSDGDTITTSINGTDEEIAKYYLGNTFRNSQENPRVCLSVKFHDTQETLGLIARNIESGWTGEIIEVTDKEDYIEIKCVEYSSDVLGGPWTREPGEYAWYDLQDCWVYDRQNKWLKTVGYKYESVTN